MSRPPFVNTSAPAAFQYPQTPSFNAPPAAFSHSAHSGGQFNGGWEGPAPALGLPVGGFGVQSEVLGMPASLNQTAIHQPWANFSPQEGLPMLPTHPTLQTQNAHQQGGHAAFSVVGAPVSCPNAHINSQNHLLPCQSVPPGQCMIATQHTSLAILPRQQWPSLDPASQIYNGVPIGNFCSNPLPGTQQWLPASTADNVVDGVPAENFYGSPPCRSNGPQQQHPLSETANHVFNGLPSGNFYSSPPPCRPSGAQQQCPLPETANHALNGAQAPNLHAIFPSRPAGAQQKRLLPETANHVFNAVTAGNLYSSSSCQPDRTQPQCPLPKTANYVVNGVPAGNFYSNSPCRPGGVPQQCKGLPVGNFPSSSPCRPTGEPQSPADTANCVVNGVPAGNFNTIPSRSPSAVIVNSPNVEVSSAHMGQSGPHQQIYCAVNNKAQLHGQPRDAVHMGTCVQQYGQSKNTWGRGRGDLGNRTPPIRSGAVWQGGRNIQSNPIPIGRVPLKCVACDRTFSNRHKMEEHKLSHVKCNENGCKYEAAGKLVTEHLLMAHNKKPVSSVNPGRSGLILSKGGEEDVRRWCEERRKNYPTSSNIQRKAQEALVRKLRGELVDEDAHRRKERLKEILVKQAELGVPVAEIPAHYISDTKHDPERKEGLISQGSINGKRATSELSKQNFNLDPTDGMRPAKMARRDRGSKLDKQQKFKDVSMASECNESPSSPDRAISATKANDNVLEGTSNLLRTCNNEVKQEVGGKYDSQKSGTLCHYFQRGKCRKGRSCQFLHERKLKKNSNEIGFLAESGISRREPNLLAKLLNGDICKEKSYVLQCFRFFVNNNFLAEWPEVALKFFSWADTELPCDIEESVAVLRLPENSSFSDVDSEDQVQSETSRLDEPNLQSLTHNGGHIPKSNVILEEDGGLATARDHQLKNSLDGAEALDNG